MTPLRLRTTTQGTSKDDVIDRCWLQARQFFGKEEHWLDMPIDVEVAETYGSIAGQILQLQWEATAYFINYGVKDREFL